MKSSQEKVRSHKRRIYIKVGGLLITLFGIVILGVTFLSSVVPAGFIVLAVIVVVIGLACMSLPEATAAVMDAILNGLSS